MHCPKCGAEVVQRAVFCHKCGERVEIPDDDRESGSSEQDSAQREHTADDSQQSPRERFRAAASAHHNDADEPEQDLWQGGYSPKAMIGRWAASAAITIALVVLAVWARNAYVAWGTVVALALLWLYQAAVLAYRRMNVRYRLTTQRFIHESGILRRTTDRIETIDMTDITFDQAILERLVGVGTIRILSSDRSHPDLVLSGIENVKEVSSLIDEVRCTERRRRGLRIDQI